MNRIKILSVLKKKYAPHILVMCLAILTITGMYYSTLYYELRIDGKYVGIVKSKQSVIALVDNMKKEIKSDFKKDINLDQEIQFKAISSSKDKLTAINIIQDKLDEMIDLKTNAFAINVNGKDAVYVKEEKIAKNILGKFKNISVENKNIKEINFLEKVAIVEKEVKITSIKNEKNAYTYLLTGNNNVQKYIVKDGDTMWTIAENNKLSMKELQNANIGINIDKLKIDQKINISMSKPIINVKKIEIASYEEGIAYNTVFEETAALYKGEKKLKIDGIDGKKKIIAEITKVNGKFSSKKILKEELIANPSNKIVLQGTKPKEMTVASGSFINPTRGILTSRFGGRWGRQHEGIDVAGSIGTNIEAADGGTVSFSGVKSGYGNVVIIDHGWFNWN